MDVPENRESEENVERGRIREVVRAENQFFFHHVNAFERETGEVCLDSIPEIYGFFDEFRYGHTRSGKTVQERSTRDLR